MRVGQEEASGELGGELESMIKESAHNKKVAPNIMPRQARRNFTKLCLKMNSFTKMDYPYPSPKKVLNRLLPPNKG